METKILTSEEEIHFSTMVKKFVTISIHQMVANISVVALSYTFAQNVVLPIMLNTLAREVLHRLRVQCLKVMSLILAVSPQNTVKQPRNDYQDLIFHSRPLLRSILLF
jgi:hypothetical protein